MDDIDLEKIAKRSDDIARELAPTIVESIVMQTKDDEFKGAISLEVVSSIASYLLTNVIVNIRHRDFPEYLISKSIQTIIDNAYVSSDKFNKDVKE